MPKNKDILQKNYFSAPEIAELLGISRVAVFKKIKNGQIHAEKIGRNYIIPKEEYEAVLGLFVPERKKKDIEATVDRVVKKYGETLRKLGKE